MTLTVLCTHWVRDALAALRTASRRDAGHRARSEARAAIGRCCGGAVLRGGGGRGVGGREVLQATLAVLLGVARGRRL